MVRKEKSMKCLGSRKGEALKLEAQAWTM
jgi:hypothetical protein